MSKRNRRLGTGIFETILLFITGLLLTKTAAEKRSHITINKEVIILLIIIVLGFISGIVGALAGDQDMQRYLVGMSICFGFVYFLAEFMIIDRKGILQCNIIDDRSGYRGDF